MTKNDIADQILISVRNYVNLKNSLSNVSSKFEHDELDRLGEIIDGVVVNCKDKKHVIRYITKNESCDVTKRYVMLALQD